MSSIFHDSMTKMKIPCDNFSIENCIDLFKVLNNEWNIHRYKPNSQKCAYHCFTVDDLGLTVVKYSLRKENYS